jgi:Rad3-related DNA helicase
VYVIIVCKQHLALTSPIQALIGDGCGIGKSLQAIAALYLIYLKAKQESEQSCKVAIVTRTSLESQMVDELTEFYNSVKKERGSVSVCIIAQ